MSDNQVIPDAAVEAAAKGLSITTYDNWGDAPDHVQRHYLSDARAAPEAAAPHMLNLAKREAWDANVEIQRLQEQARLAHLDAVVNRATNRADLAEAWDSGHQSGFWRGRKSNGYVTGYYISVEHAKKHNPYR